MIHLLSNREPETPPLIPTKHTHTCKTHTHTIGKLRSSNSVKANPYINPSKCLNLGDEDLKSTLPALS